MEVINFRLASGEHYSLLVDDSGIPLELPLLYSLSLRHRGGSDKIRKAMLRLRDWYQAFALQGLDSEALLREGRLVPDDVGAALRLLERHASEEDGEQGGSSDWMWNDRLIEWTRFVRWALLRSNWTYGSAYERTRHQFDADRDRSEFFCTILDDLKRPNLNCGIRSEAFRGFSQREMEALEAVFERVNGQYVRSPFDAKTTLRNHAVFILLRYGGIRRSEAANVGILDIPPRETKEERFLRVELERRALAIRVQRRHDDPSDPRREEPRTKRWARDVALPDHTFEILWRLIASLPPADHGYLVRSSSSPRPLSVRQFGNVAARILERAAEIHEERWPGDKHTLCAGNCHRFRHHRAVELLPTFFPDGPDTVLGRERYCAHFGWENLASADPYIRLLHLRDAERLNTELRRTWLDAREG